MGIFGDQALRLLREDWASAKMLAEELYAIFNSTDPLTITSPVNIQNSSGQPGLTITNFGPAPAPLRIEKRPEPPWPFVPGAALPPFGSFSFSDFFPDGSIVPQGGSGTKPSSSQPGASSFPAKVLSGGPGASYQVSVYTQGLNSAPTKAAATQLQIDAAATIPAGTWCFVSQVNGAYYMQVPVWLEDQS